MNHVNKSLCHEFPLREDYCAQLVIPVNLTQREADRLCEFIKALIAPASPTSTSTGEPNG